MNYYKIINKNKCHHKLRHKVGLNIDPLPFNPSGSCEAGGIYFASENILHFLKDDSKYIVKITIPDDAKVYKDPGSLEKWKADRLIFGEFCTIDLLKIKELLSEGANLADSVGKWVCANSNKQAVEFLWYEGVNFDEVHLSIAIENNRRDIVDFLLEQNVTISYTCNTVLKYAALYNYEDIIKLCCNSEFFDANSEEAASALASVTTVDMMNFLLSKKIKMNASVMHVASCRGRCDIIKLFFDLGYKLCYRSDFDGLSYVAIVNGYKEASELFVKYKDSCVGYENSIRVF